MISIEAIIPSLPLKDSQSPFFLSDISSHETDRPT
jgi:hypothetical protein